MDARLCEGYMLVRWTHHAAIVGDETSGSVGVIGLRLNDKKSLMEVARLELEVLVAFK